MYRVYVVLSLFLVSLLGCSDNTGTSTSRGAPGAPGVAGTNGTNGVDGKAGTNGKDGIAGTNGKDGTDGKDGAKGDQGLPGLNGKDGVSCVLAEMVLTCGETSITLVNGLNGNDGKDGTDGVAGKDGNDGKDGTDGVAGKDGKDGTDGKDGAVGPAGPQGTPGLEAQVFDPCKRAFAQVDFGNSTLYGLSEQLLLFGNGDLVEFTKGTDGYGALTFVTVDWGGGWALGGASNQQACTFQYRRVTIDGATKRCVWFPNGASTPTSFADSNATCWN